MLYTSMTSWIMRSTQIIVMSATLQADQFSTYFNNARVLYIQGRQYPVQVITCSMPRPLLLYGFTDILFS